MFYFVRSTRSPVSSGHSVDDAMVERVLGLQCRRSCTMRFYGEAETPVFALVHSLAATTVRRLRHVSRLQKGKLLFCVAAGFSFLISVSLWFSGSRE